MKEYSYSLPLTIYMFWWQALKKKLEDRGNSRPTLWVQNVMKSRQFAKRAMANGSGDIRTDDKKMIRRLRDPICTWGATRCGNFVHAIIACRVVRRQPINIIVKLSLKFKANGLRQIIVTKEAKETWQELFQVLP